MAVRILEGRKINEGDRASACFYDSTTGLAYGPMFEDAEEAERFLTYLASVDPGRLCWDGREWDSGNRLYHQWLKEGKPEKRPVFQFDYEWLDTQEACEDEEVDQWYVFASDMECLFPLFIGYDCNEIGAILNKHGVGLKGEIDTESSCVYARFKTEAASKAFIDRFNGFLRDNWHKAYPEG